jgi:hypothetical protein
VHTHYSKLFLSVLVLTFFACQPAIIKENRIYEETLAPVNFFYPDFKDDMDWDSLISALTSNREYLKRLDPQSLFHYGPHTFLFRKVFKGNGGLGFHENGRENVGHDAGPEAGEKSGQDHRQPDPDNGKVSPLGNSLAHPEDHPVSGAVQSCWKIGRAILHRWEGLIS